MTTFTVVIAAPGLANGVREVLGDWSAGGLIQPFVWAEPGGELGHDVAATLVAHGRAEPVSLRSALADVAWDHAQVAVLMPLFDGSVHVSTRAEDHVLRILEQGAGPGLRRIRCAFTRPGQTRDVPSFARSGWHNVLLSPQDADGPDAPSAILAPSQDLLDIGVHACPGLVGILGLWTNTTGSPIDALPVSVSESARLATTYYRSLGTDELEARLREAVLTTDDGFPRPRRHGAVAVYVDDVGLATSNLAQAWWEKHRGALRGRRDTVPVSVAKPIGAIEALRMFLQFLVAAVKNAPVEWLRRKLHDVSVTTAAKVHGLVFGPAGSAYSVVVNGLTAQGLPAQWQDYSTAAGSIDATLTRAGGARVHEAHADLSALWSDYVSGALTLADAGDRVAALPPVRVGVDAGIVRRVSDITPPASTAFRTMAAHVAAAVQMAPVAPYDVLAADTLEQRLSACATQPGMQLDATRAANELAAWRESHASSFASAIGARLGRAMTQTRDEVQALLQTIAEAVGDGEVAVEQQNLQRRMARRMRLLLILLVTVIVVAAVATGIGVVAVVIGIAAGAVLGLGTLAAMVVTFMRGQQRLFQVLNRQRATADRAKVAEANLHQAVRDLRRLTDAYGQFLEWTRVLAVMLSSPLGQAVATTAAPVALAGPFPRSTKIGRAQPDEAVVRDVAAELRRDVFATGWLSGPWTHVLASAATRVDLNSRELRENPDRMYGELAVTSIGDQSVLSRWVDAVTADGIGNVGGDKVWAEVLDLMRSRYGAQCDRLTDSVEVLGLGGPRTMGLHQFLAGVGAPAQTSPGRIFDGGVLGARAAVLGAPIAKEVVSHKSVGLGWVVSRTELSDPIMSYDFQLADPHHPEPSSSPDERAHRERIDTSPPPTAAPTTAEPETRPNAYEDPQTGQRRPDQPRPPDRNADDDGDDGGDFGWPDSHGLVF